MRIILGEVFDVFLKMFYRLFSSVPQIGFEMFFPSVALNAFLQLGVFLNSLKGYLNWISFLPVSCFPPGFISSLNIREPFDLHWQLCFTS